MEGPNGGFGELAQSDGKALGIDKACLEGDSRGGCWRGKGKPRRVGKMGSLRERVRLISGSLSMGKLGSSLFVEQCLDT